MISPTFLTSAGKILNIRFLLIFLSMILFLDIYTKYVLYIDLWYDYTTLLNLRSIIELMLIYLILVNVVIPMIGFTLSISFFLISHIPNRTKLGEGISQFFSYLFSNNELLELQELEHEAIQQNNSALMKSYELKLEEYKEMHTMYLFSFFLLLEVFFLFFYSQNYKQEFVYKIVLFFYSEDSREKPNDFWNLVVVFIPLSILVFYAFRYITSFNLLKIHKWIKVNLFSESEGL